MFDFTAFQCCIQNLIVFEHGIDCLRLTEAFGRFYAFGDKPLFCGTAQSFLRCLNITVIGKERGCSAGVMRQWQREKSALTILMDQRASGRSGVRLPFFGRETFVYTSPARIALKSACPIIFGAFVRDGLLHYRMYSTDPLEIERTGDFDEDVKRLTALLLKHLEGCIRRWPEQYLWMHNRWKA